MSIFRQFKDPIGITGFLIRATSSWQSHIFRPKFHWSFLGCFCTPLFSPETWNFSLFVPIWNGTTNFTFCFLSFWYYFVFLACCIPVHSVGTIPFNFMAPYHLQLCCLSPLSLYTFIYSAPHACTPSHRPPTFTAIWALKPIHVNTITPFSSSKFTFNIFTKSLPPANTASQRVDRRASLFLHISLSNCWLFLFAKCIFLGASSVFLFSLCFALYSKQPALNVLFVFIFWCPLPSGSHKIHQKSKLLVLV